MTPCRSGPARWDAGVPRCLGPSLPLHGRAHVGRRRRRSRRLSSALAGLVPPGGAGPGLERPLAWVLARVGAVRCEPRADQASRPTRCGYSGAPTTTAPAPGRRTATTRRWTDSRSASCRPVRLQLAVPSRVVISVPSGPEYHDTRREGRYVASPFTIRARSGMPLLVQRHRADGRRRSLWWAP